MSTRRKFKCDRCGMSFSTSDTFSKHRSRFCTGLKVDSSGRKSQHTHFSTSMRDSKPAQSLPTDKKRAEIRDWRNKRDLVENVHDMEDRISHDSQKTQKLADGVKRRTQDYNDMLGEYEQLQVQERNLMREMFNIQGQPTSRQANSQLEALQRRTARLKEERQTLEQKLEGSMGGEQDMRAVTNRLSYRLLRETKDQQDLNEEAFLLLKKRLENHESVPSVSRKVPLVPISSRSIQEDIDSPGYIRFRGFETNVFLPDPDLEDKLRDYEYYPWLTAYPEPLVEYHRIPKHLNEDPDDDEKPIKKENQRLQKELEEMDNRFQNLDSRTRELELSLATSRILDLKVNDPAYRYSSAGNIYPPLNASVSSSPRLTHPGRGRESSASSVSTSRRRSTVLASSSLSKLQSPLEPKAYNPTAGFVIFFDFIVNFPPNVDQCRLITCLHHPQSGLGEPSHLEPLKCDLFLDEDTGERMSVALVATKQPVPKCPAQPALAVVIEVQLTSRHAPREMLLTRAWTKIPLFDHKKRLSSGRWKVPLRALPIRQDEDLALINTLPKFGRAELHYRLVNFQDASDQSSAPISPSFGEIYYYPSESHHRSYMS